MNEKSYIKPQTKETRLQTLCGLLAGSDTVPVNPGQEGDQTGAEARQGTFLTITSVWE